MTRALAGEKQATELLAQWNALTLRVGGSSVQSIAEQLGMSMERVATLLRGAYRRLAELNPVTAQEARDLDLARYDEMLLVLWAKVRGGHIESIKTALQVLRDRQALGGYAQPARVEVTGKGGGPIELQSWSSLAQECLADEDRERAGRPALPS